MNKPFSIVFLLSILLFATPLRAQLPDHWSVVPLDTGNAVEPNTNNIIFFPHPVVGNPTKNFKEGSSHVTYNNGRGEMAVFDLAGAPGFPVTSPAKRTFANIRAMLADPAGLCYENLLLSLACSSSELSGAVNQLSFQQLVADLRNYLPGETRVAGLAPEVANVALAGNPDDVPYDQFGLGSIVANLGNWDRDSPPAICYDIVSFDHWIACPVFGKIYVQKWPVAIPDQQRDVITLQSPIILYQEDKVDHRYHLVGYLANPSPYDYSLFDTGNPNRRVRVPQHFFPQAIAALGGSNIVVMNSATLIQKLCHNFDSILEAAGHPPFPWKLNCTYGVVWSQTSEAVVGAPLRDKFDSKGVLIAAPKIYDLAVGNDGNGDNKKEVLFAPSNEPDPQGKVYVLKYLEENFAPINLADLPRSAFPRDFTMGPGWGFFVPPHPIEVQYPPEETDQGYGPFKIATMDINGDGYSDFALTWKKSQDVLADTEHHIWRGMFSPYVSVFISSPGTEGVSYTQYNFKISGSNPKIAAVAFGQFQNQNYLVAGNDQRERTEDGQYHAFAYLFPIAGGTVDNFNIPQKIKVSFKEGRMDAPGVGDLTTDPTSGVIGASLNSPFIRAPETCDVNRGRGGVYGYLWLGEVQTKRGVLAALDFDRDGIPNRCECLDEGLFPDSTNDADGDELVDDPAHQCDSCPGSFNDDLETNEEDAIAGDGVADACDNCPPNRCANRPVEGMNCINPNQADSDNDGVGNTCDACPDSANLVNGGLYVADTNCIETCFTGIDCCTPNFCSFCASGYLMRDGHFRWYVNAPQILNNGCTSNVDIDAIVAPTGVSSPRDMDGDGVPNARDNCVYISNPPRPVCGRDNQSSACGTSGNHPSGQRDSDDDGSGDACDCPNANRWDDCDNDNTPNRFDDSPCDGAPGASCPPWTSSSELQPPDTVYDPYAKTIADVRDLKQATGSLNLNQSQMRNNAEEALGNANVQDMRGRMILNPTDEGPEGEVLQCGYPQNTYPGPYPCDYMGGSGKEVTVILPTPSPPRTVLPPCIPGQDPACTPPPPPDVPNATSVAQYCIAKVGRENPKTAAVFPEEQAQIIQANDRAQAITGIPNFDIFVGADGGVIHWECVFAAGAYAPSVARSISMDAFGASPEVSAQVGSFLFAQLSGLPPIQYTTRPDLTLEIKAPHALLLAPVLQEGAPSPSLPNLSLVLPNRQLSRIPAQQVQVGEMRENIQGNMVLKVLNASMDIASEGTSLAVNNLQSLVVIDYKSTPGPSTGTSIERRMYNIDQVLTELKNKVDDWSRRGRPITVEIYRDLHSWESSMRPEFLLAQNTVPAAVASINASLAVDPSVARVVAIGSTELVEALPPGHINSIVLPVYVKEAGLSMGGGGCGCRVSSETLSLAALLYFLCIFMPVPVFIYYRSRHCRSRYYRSRSRRSKS